MRSLTMCRKPAKKGSRRCLRKIARTGQSMSLLSAVITVMLLLGLAAVPGCQDMKGYRQGVSPAGPPAGDLRAKHQYRYYPDSAVYMDVARKTFFYRNGEKWMTTTLLPASVRVDWKRSWELDTDKPYQYHADIAKKYPPAQGKKREKPPTENY